MANETIFSGSIVDGNVRIHYEIDCEVVGSSVTFTARITGSAVYAKYSNSEHTYIFAGNSREYATLVADGVSSAGVKCTSAYSYGIHAIRSGWIATGETASTSLTVPLKGGSYALELMATGNGGQSAAHSIVLAGASSLTLSGSRELGTPQILTVLPVAPGLMHAVSYTAAAGSGVIAEITEETELLWTPPCALCTAVTTSRSVPITFTVDTYSGTELIGTSELSEILTVPDNEETRPGLSVCCTPQNDGLPAAFAGLYIASRSRVRTDFTASAKLGADPVRYASSVNGAWSEGNPALSALLSVSGTVEVLGTVEDSRGLQTTVRETITVLPYAVPAVVPYGGESAIRCERCRADGTPTSTGTSLHIRCARQFSALGGANAAALEGRIKRRDAEEYGAWSTLLAFGTPGSLDTILELAVPDTHAAYDVELRCLDTLGESGTQHLIVLTDETPFHLARGGAAVGLGRYAELSRGRSVQFGWPVYFDRGVYVGESALGEYLYPVGSLCRSTDGDFDPAEFYGGTWSYRGETSGIHEWNRTA